MMCFLTQSKSEVKKESAESSPSEVACLCSPPAAKNQCANCGMEIHDRYLLKVRNHLGKIQISKKRRNTGLDPFCCFLIIVFI